MAPPALIRAPDGTAFALHGPQDAPMVVLIHGLGLTHAVWDTVLPHLAAQFRVLTYDLQGHGQTPPPAHPPDLAMLARQLAGLLDHLGTAQAAVVGFSLGGMIARRFAQDYPARVLGLGLLNTPHRRTAQAQAAILDRVAEVLRDGPAATVEPALIRWFSDEFRAANPAMMDLVRSWVLANDRAVYPLFYRVFAEGVAEVVAPNPPLTCPTLVITADQDHGNSPDMARAIAAEIAGSQTLLLPGLRHMALMEAPDLVGSALRDFLHRVVPRS